MRGVNCPRSLRNGTQRQRKSERGNRQHRRRNRRQHPARAVRAETEQARILKDPFAFDARINLDQNERERNGRDDHNARHKPQTRPQIRQPIFYFIYHYAVC
jgi:hypothetical protein